MPATLEFGTLYALDLPFGAERLRLAGVARLSTDAVEFGLDDALPPWLPAGLAPRDLTARVAEPLGLPGVVLSGLSLTGTLRRDAPVQLAVRADASFPRLAGLTLSSSVVIDGGATRLVRVGLDTTSPLTLTQLLEGLIGGGAAWGAPVTDQFAFVSGEIYRLQPPAEADPSTYVFELSKGDGDVERYRTGFRVAGTFELFGAQRFAVELAVGPAVDAAAFGKTRYTPTASDLTLVTTVPQDIALDFLSLIEPRLAIARLGEDLILQVETGLTAFGTSVGTLTANYDRALDAFAGRIAASVAGYDLSLAIRWSRAQGFQIAAADGLGAQAMALVQQMQDSLSADDADCGELVAAWFDEILGSKVSAAVSGPFARDGDRLEAPVTVTYQMIVADQVVCRVPVSFAVRLALPRSLGDLPGALWAAVADNAPAIALAVLSDPDAYAILAHQAGLKGGARASARFLCRARKPDPRAPDDPPNEAKLQKTLDSVVTLAGDTIAAIAELAAAMIAVAVATVATVLAVLKAIWDEIKSWFGDDDDHEAKAEAEAKITAIHERVAGPIELARAKVAEARDRIRLQGVEVSVTAAAPGLAILATCRWAQDAPPDESLGGLRVALDYLTGAPESSGVAILSQVRRPPQVSTPLATLLAAMPPDPPQAGYQMNLRATPVLTGVQFLTPDTRGQIAQAVSALREISDSDVASGFADYLTAFDAEFAAYARDGIRGDAIYGRVTPAVLTLDASRIGLTTRVPA